MEQQTRLEEVGMLWDPYDAQWWQHLEEMGRFKATFGHCNVSPRVVEGFKSLGIWVQEQRARHR